MCYFLSVSVNSCSGAILGATQGGATAVDAELITLQRGICVPQNWHGDHYGVPLIIFAKSHQIRMDRLKPLTHRAHLLKMCAPPTVPVCVCLWPLVAHQAWMKRSPLQLSSQTAMIVLQGGQKIASAFWSAVVCTPESERKARTEVTVQFCISGEDS